MTEPVPTARDYAQASLRDLTSHYLDLLDTDVRARQAPPGGCSRRNLSRSASCVVWHTI